MMTRNFIGIAEQLRESLRQLDRVRAISPDDPDLTRLKAALRERIDDLECLDETSQHDNEFSIAA